MQDMSMAKTLWLAVGAVALAAPTPILAEENARPSYAEQKVETEQVADAYFDAYIARDWDRLEPLLADDASFADPTAELVFGNPPTRGRDAIAAKFRKGYSSISAMSFDPIRVFHGGNMALYEGTLSWTLNFADGNVLDSSMPYVAIIRVEGGKVVSHRDYGDYTDFIAGVRALRVPAKE